MMEVGAVVIVDFDNGGQKRKGCGPVMFGYHALSGPLPASDARSFRTNLASTHLHLLTHPIEPLAYLRAKNPPLTSQLPPKAEVMKTAARHAPQLGHRSIGVLETPRTALPQTTRSTIIYQIPHTAEYPGPLKRVGSTNTKTFDLKAPPLLSSRLPLTRKSTPLSLTSDLIRTMTANSLQSSLQKLSSPIEAFFAMYPAFDSDPKKNPIGEWDRLCQYRGMDPHDRNDQRVQKFWELFMGAINAHFLHSFKSSSASPRMPFRSPQLEPLPQISRTTASCPRSIEESLPIKSTSVQSITLAGTPSPILASPSPTRSTNPPTRTMGLPPICTKFRQTHSGTKTVSPLPTVERFLWAYYTQRMQFWTPKGAALKQKWRAVGQLGDQTLTREHITGRTTLLQGTNVSAALIKLFNKRYGTNANSLSVWRRLCVTAGVQPGATLDECHEVRPFLLGRLLFP